MKQYTDLVQEANLMEAFDHQIPVIETLFNSIDEERSTYSYAPEKWSIKCLVQHITDAERIFGYRALCIARGEKQNLPGFEENDYAMASIADTRPWQDIREEFLVNRRSVMKLFHSFNATQLAAIGLSNGTQRSVEEIGKTIIGHFAHHLKVLHERYRV